MCAAPYSTHGTPRGDRRDCKDVVNVSNASLFLFFLLSCMVDTRKRVVMSSIKHQLRQYLVSGVVVKRRQRNL